MISLFPKEPKRVNLVKPIMKYVNRNYIVQESVKLDEDLKQLEENRNRLCRNYGSREDLEKVIEMHYKYIQSTFTLGNNLEFGKDGSFLKSKLDKKICIDFNWGDSLRPERHVTTSNIKVERINMMFNCAIYHARNALSQNRKTEKGIKKAIGEFRTAASIFSLLMEKTRDIKIEDKTMDMAPNYLALATLIMQAQAQLCFFEKAQDGGFSDEIISEVAMSVSEIYRKSEKIFERDEHLLSWVKKSDYPYHSHVKAQKELFSATSYFWKSKSYATHKKYGHEIVYLRQAKEMLKKASKSRTKYTIEQIKNSIDNLMKTVQEKLDSAEDDNNSIYHYAIPDFQKLPEITPRLFAKIQRFKNEKFDSDFAGTALTSLVPFHVLEMARKLKEVLKLDLEELYKNTKERIEKKKIQLQEFEYLMNSAEKEDHENSRIHTNLVGIFYKIKGYGDYTNLQAGFEKVLKTHLQIEKRVKNTKKILQNESRLFEENKIRYLNYWDLIPSEKLNSAYTKDLEIIENYLKSADKTNNQMEEKLKGLKSLLEFVESQNFKKIEESMPMVEKRLKDSKEMKEIEAIKIKAESLIAELDEFTLEAKENLNQEKTTMLMKMCPKEPTSERANREVIETARNEEMRNFDETFKDFSEKITAEIDHLRALCEETDSVFRKDSKHREKANIVEKYRQLLAGLEVFHKAKMEGLHFYGVLETKYVNTLEAKTRDFINSRTKEFDAKIKAITRNISQRDDVYFGEFSGANPGYDNRMNASAARPNQYTQVKQQAGAGYHQQLPNNNNPYYQGNNNNPYYNQVPNANNPQTGQMQQGSQAPPNATNWGAQMPENRSFPQNAHSPNQPQHPGQSPYGAAHHQRM